MAWMAADQKLPNASQGVPSSSTSTSGSIALKFSLPFVQTRGPSSCQLPDARSVFVKCEMHEMLSPKNSELEEYRWYFPPKKATSGAQGSRLSELFQPWSPRKAANQLGG